MTDPITDMLNRIRNAQAVFHSTVAVPFSKIKHEIAQILEKEGFVGKTEKKGRGVNKQIKINLKYHTSENKKEPIISNLRRVSKPGQRIYIRAGDIKSVRSGYGINIISTSKGMMTNKEARKQNLGGEVICEIW